MSGSSSDPSVLDALAALVADARVHLEDAIARGVREEEAAAQAPVAARRPEWFDLAAQARSDSQEVVVEAAPVDDGLSRAERLERVRQDLGDCRRCALCQERKSLVFGVGTAEADLLIVGEAPGQQEDEQGEPFVGPAGQMLDKMLENVLGLRREQVYILNVVKCRPPKNRNPLPDEVEACRPFLEAQLTAIQPKVLLVLGSVAYRTLFEPDAGIMKNRGRWREYRGVPAMPTFHPAYLLRSPQDKRYTFEDLKQVRDRYDRLGGRR